VIVAPNFKGVNGMVDLEKSLRDAVDSGKAYFGYKQALTSAKNGRAILFIVASNCPIESRKELMHWANLSNVPIHLYKGNSKDLGMACGKPFSITNVTIRDAGKSDILKLIED
jgi:large subunit ribosomal protein L30e